MNDEIRITNDEAKPKSETRNPKRAELLRFRHSSLGHSNLIRHSSFGVRPCRRAFTLIEVLASIAIIALVLPVVMYGLSLATNAASLARHRTQATALAQAKLDELLVTQDFSSTAGDFGDQYPGYKWTVAINSWSAPDSSGNSLSSSTQQLDVTVSWTQRSHTYEASLSTVLYQGPSSSSSGLGGLLP